MAVRQFREPSSLGYLNNRHYDPTTGIFLSVDPLVVKTGEPYIYGSANPTTYSDPSGLETCRLDANNQPTVCFDDFDFYVAQRAVQVGSAASAGYDTARSSAGFIPSTDETWMGVRAVNQELRKDLAAFCEPGSVSLQDFLFDVGKGAGKSIAAGALGGAAGSFCAPGGPWAVAGCAIAAGAATMVGLDAIDAFASGEIGEYAGFPVLESGVDGALAGGFGAVFGRATAARWNAVRTPLGKGVSLGLVRAYYNDPGLTIRIVGSQLPARATATSVRRAVAWAMAGGGNRTLNVSVR